MNAVQAVPKQRRATIFSSYVSSFFDGTIKNKLERFNVTITRIIDPNRSDSFDISDSDVVLVTRELTDPREVKKLEEKLKKCGLPYFKLHRQLGEWEEAFSRLDALDREKERRTVLAPVDSARGTAVVRRITNDRCPACQSTKKLGTSTCQNVWHFLTEGTTSIELVPAPIVDVPKPTDPAVELAEAKEWIGMLESEVGKLTKENEDLSVKQVSLNKVHSDLSAELNRQRSQVTTLRSENETLKRELDESHATASELQTELGELQKTPKSKKDMDVILSSFKALWKSGVMSSEEILKKLFKEDK